MGKNEITTGSTVEGGAGCQSHRRHRSHAAKKWAYGYYIVRTQF